VLQTKDLPESIVILSMFYTFLLSLLETKHEVPLIERVSEPRTYTYNVECHVAAGSPHLSFKDAMEAEHCKRAGCNEEFETSNYGIRRRVSGAVKNENFCMRIKKNQIV
jgi:hypothetical protein